MCLAAVLGKALITIPFFVIYSDIFLVFFELVVCQENNLVGSEKSDEWRGPGG